MQLFFISAAIKLSTQNNINIQLNLLRKALQICYQSFRSFTNFHTLRNMVDYEDLRFEIIQLVSMTFEKVSDVKK